MKLKFLALFAVLFILIGLPTVSALAQGQTADPSELNASKIYSWIGYGLAIISVPLALITAYLVAKTQAQGKELDATRDALRTARADIPTLDRVEAGLVTALKPAGVDLLNSGGNAFFNFAMMLLASRVSPDDLKLVGQLQEYFNTATDRQPNAPPAPGTPNNPLPPPTETSAKG